jgi:protein SCO1/2
MQRRSRLVFFIWGSVAATIFALAALLFVAQIMRSRAKPAIYAQVPDFTFIKQDGQPFGLKDMLGKVNVVDFIFTSCREECPAMTLKMAELYNLFENTKNVHFVSISVDPAHDSLSVLQQYAADNGVTDERWTFLWHPVDDIVWLSEKGFLLAAKDLPENHSNRFILVDQIGHIRGYYDISDSASMARLMADIRQLLKKA